MKATFLIVIGLLVVAGGITGLIHPQWQGRNKKMDVQYGDKHYVVTTRRIVDVPIGFCISIIVAGSCTAALGLITQANSRQPK